LNRLTLAVLAGVLRVRCSAAPSPAQEVRTAFTNAHIIPISGPEIEHGVLFVQNGTITAVGDEKSVKIPEGVTIVDLKGRPSCRPGGHPLPIGGIGGADGSAPIQPDCASRSLSVMDSGSGAPSPRPPTTSTSCPGSGPS